VCLCAPGGGMREMGDDELAQLRQRIAELEAERKRAEAERRERTAQLEALEEAAAVVSSTLHLDRVLDCILEQGERVIPGDAFNIMLIEGDAARIVRWRGREHLGAEGQVAGLAIPVAGCPNLAKMAQTGEPVVVPDTVSDPDWVSLEGEEWLRSYVGAPIRVGGVTVGFLNVDSSRPGQFGPTDANRLRVFANHAATALENARLRRELCHHAGRLEQRVQERTAQLAAQYARLEAILHSASTGIAVTDRQGEILEANPIVHTWLTERLSPEDAAWLLETVRDLARRAEERPKAVLELTGLDLELGAAPISEWGTEKAAAVVDIHDVSHLKALDRIKSRFVTDVSHELRTPVATIKMYAYLMRRQPEKWRDYLDPLAQEADHQAQLVLDILQIARVDAGRLMVKPAPTSLDELIEAAIASYYVLAESRELTLEHHPAAGGRLDAPPVVALVDPQRMVQVLNNLVENAICYTPEGGRVVVSASRQEAGGRVWATVAVADTGMGIPEEELAHVFDRFFRGVEPRLMQISGTGLGLSIVREIVELHGGHVTVESRVGEGSTFTVWLPLAD